ncbi:MAG TPA: RNA-binding protein [Lentisphaeria bacterium]|nr:MAG: RNA-binding protein [Lentisphaerae bacterium GWF2_49_21]HBC86523.1 RNA-binding protein [Lentisphaeria bacterium]
MKVLYVGNLPFTTTEEEVKAMYEQFGTVNSVKIIKDKESGRSRGFGFVEMDDDAALKAIEGTNGKDMGGRNLRVNEAREKREGGNGGGERRSFNRDR